MVDKQIDELRGMVAPKGITIELDPAARAWLAAKGFDRAFGARPMARLIERVIKKPLSELLLFGSLADGGTLQVAVEGDELRLQPVGADTRRPGHEPPQHPSRVSRRAARARRGGGRSVRAVRAAGSSRRGRPSPTRPP